MKIIGRGESVRLCDCDYIEIVVVDDIRCRFCGHVFRDDWELTESAIMARNRIPEIETCQKQKP